MIHFEYKAQYLNLKKGFRRDYHRCAAWNVKRTKESYKVRYNCPWCSKYVSAEGTMYNLISELYTGNVLKLRLCKSCWKAHKVFPPSIIDLEKMIKAQLNAMNNYFEQAERDFEDFCLADFRITAIRYSRS